ncbi:hypothetical protein [Acidiphilium multivorum]|uniref:hypothetical protein n=1 Tax=Acidiphilium multivorum TaxID=62140 RepID=UPI0011DD0DB8|nr:hypothetical protein [Acidiphilium multivorum]
MSNFSRSTLLRVGRLLNPGKASGHLARLAECAGTTRKTIRNWSAETSDPQFRAMSGTAKRAVAVLAYFALTGQLTRERMEDVITLEQAMEDDRRFERLAARITQLLEEEKKNADE